MKKLLWVILAAMVLGTVVPGCRHVPCYDRRLTAADSMMRTAPGSALAMLEALAPDSSVARSDGGGGIDFSDADRAYYALLLTQARYKCYVTATSDSAINLAFAYFSAHPADHEKLTRTYIYKGAVMEELGHPDSAMLYYKTAEGNADHNDYFNLGYCNTRIGSLYRYYYADAHACYETYKEAFDYYKKANDSIMLLNSLYNMGMCSGVIGNGEAQRDLQAASSLALELNDSSVYYDSQERLIRQQIYRGSSVKHAQMVALHLFQDYRNYMTCDLLIDLANLYILDSKIDSAKYYLRMLEDISGPDDNVLVTIRKLSTLADIAKIEGDLKRFHDYADKSRSLSDSIKNNTIQYDIQFIENKVNEESAAIIKKTKYRRQWIIGFSAIVFMLLMSTLVTYQYRKIRIVKSIIRELKSEKVNGHDSLLQEMNARDSSIVQLVENLVAFMRTSMDAAEKDSPKVFKKRIRDSVQNVVDENFWKELRTYLDTKHNNIISNIAKNKRINETDIRFIELVCCGFSYLEIAITLGYSPNFVSNKRIRVTKKLGLKSSLQEYLTAAMNADINS